MCCWENKIELLPHKPCGALLQLWVDDGVGKLWQLLLNKKRVSDKITPKQKHHLDLHLTHRMNNHLATDQDNNMTAHVIAAAVAVAATTITTTEQEQQQ